jgi:peptidoglycan hydrolase-like amidase
MKRKGLVNLKLTRHLVHILVAVGLVLGVGALVGAKSNSATNYTPETQTDLVVINKFQNSEIDSPLFSPSEWDEGLTLDQDETGYDSRRSVILGPVHSDHPFNAYNMRWKADLPEHTDLTLETRYSDDASTWSGWKRVLDPTAELDDQGRDDGIGLQAGKDGVYTYGDLFFVDNEKGLAEYIEIRVTLKTDDEDYTPTLDDMVIEFINTYDQTTTNQVSTAKAASTIPTVISRSQWGANEAYLDWTPRYQAPTKFFIHHTVTANNDPNPAATVRAIYYYHAVTRGWGDIGYNYLVDSQGKIYEGRKGGNGVIGAHTLSYNSGSIGIAVLGDYRSGSLATATRTSIENLIAHRSYLNAINPIAKWTAGSPKPGTKHNISGHRDAGNTTCPGDNVYSKLSTIRSNTNQKYLTFQGPYRLVKSPDAGSVYLLADGESQIRYIPNPDIFKNWGFLWTQVETIDLSGYSAGPVFGNVIKNSSEEIYLLNKSVKYRIPDADTLAGWGFDSNDVVQLPNGLLDFYLGSDQTLSVLVKELGKTSVFHVRDGQKLHIRSMLALTQWGFDPNTIQTIPNSVISVLGAGPAISHVVKSPDASAVYLIDKSSKVKVKDSAAMQRWNLSFADVTVIDQSLLDEFTTDPNLLDRQAKVLSGTSIYYIHNGNRYHIPSAPVYFAWGYSWGTAPELTADFLVRYPQKNSLSKLVKSAGGTSVHLITSGSKWHILNMASFIAWGFDSNEVGELPASLIDEVPLAGELSNLIQYQGESSVYLLEDQKLRYIPSSSLFNTLGFSWDDITTPSVEVIDAYTTVGTPLYPLMKANNSSSVYAISSSAKHHITSSQSFNAWGFDWNYISEVDPSIVESIATGPALPSANSIVRVNSTNQYRIYDTNNVKLSDVDANTESRSGYAGGIYFVKQGATFFKASSLPIRFIPVISSNMIRVTSYNDIPSWDPSLNDNIFRGLVEVRYSTTSGKLWVINELPIESYLKGIAETSTTSHATHLKTMTVAARSYAYYHVSNGGKHAGESFDLKNSRKGNGDDQVYKGYGLESRFPALVQAVSDTANKVVSYGGNAVITPYYSRSDGNTRSWQSVWGGPGVPWCVSVPDPDSNGMSLLGHGVGLPGYGALKRAERGDSYQAILSYYYSGTSLKTVGNPNVRIAIYGI